MRLCKKTILLFLLVAIEFSLLAQNLVSSWTDPFWSSDSKKITYSSHDGNDWEIYVLNVATGEIAQITDNQFDDSSPSWSPRGDRIIYESNAKGNVDIFAINLEDEKVTQLTDHPTEDSEPVYSPNGDLIAFSSFRTGDPQIFLMDADGSDKRQLTLQGRNEMANWSPDGSKLVYHSNWAGHWEVHIIGKDGSNMWSPTHSPDEEEYGKWNSKTGKYIGVPSFSPNGKEVIFHAAPEKVTFGIYRIDLETLDIREVINTPDNESFPSWSPDGRFIAFRYRQNNEWGLYLIEPDGSNLKFMVQLRNPG